MKVKLHFCVMLGGSTTLISFLLLLLFLVFTPQEGYIEKLDFVSDLFFNGLTVWLLSTSILHILNKFEDLKKSLLR